MNERPKCSCGNLCRPNGRSKKTGEKLWKTYCASCSKARHGKKEREYRLYKKDTCEACGFAPKHPCQLDVHHLAHNHYNNEESNLQTLCANCHRLVHEVAQVT